MIDGTNPFKKIDLENPKFKDIGAERLAAKALIFEDLMLFEDIAEELNYSMTPLNSRFNQSYDSLNGYVKKHRTDLQTLFQNSSPEEELIRIEREHMQSISHLIDICEFDAFQILYSYSLFIEKTGNSEYVKCAQINNFLECGPLFENTQEKWIALVKYASNYSRHFEEWREGLRSFSEKDLSYEEAIMKLNSRSRGQIIALLKLNGLREELSFSECLFGANLVRLLKLNHDHEGLLLFQAWLLDLQNSFYSADQEASLFMNVIMPALRKGVKKRNYLKRLTNI